MLDFKYIPGYWRESMLKILSVVGTNNPCDWNS
nr:MAG TPA: hypothetical protein [Caudoviricetes sp.]